MSDKNWVRTLVVGLASLVAMSACTRNAEVPNDPKKRLTDYISRSFDVRSVEDRAQLLQYLTGNAKSRLSAWSDEQFRMAFIESKRKFEKLVFIDAKSPSPAELEITYELSYLDQNKGHDAKVTNKKLAQMVQEQGQWLINDVHNINELVEYRNEMSLP